ncbi:porin family protein [Formosa sp. A9]|uniref:porin family protein n=1 Tax=Formosa sp. A9 TaxID=3442641 RepID=UPI003EC01DBC
MFKQYLVLLFVMVLGVSKLSAQTDTTAVSVIDSLYKEDQFYLGISYNILNNMPSKMKQNGFSLGLQGGFIKDMPLNSKRNIALGLGLGYAFNTFNQNMGVHKSPEGEEIYIVLNEDYDFNYERNNFYLHQVELPIEFRWRTSTPESYRFWRIYSGFKFSYVFTNITNFKSPSGNERHVNIDGFNPFQYGLTLSAGYNTWNFYFYYGLNTLFEDDAKTFIYQRDIDMNVIQLGLIFYLL